MAVKNMFHQGQAEPGSALRAAVADIHPVEAFGQPRQMFRSNAGAEIADHDTDFRRALAGCGLGQGNDHPPAGRAVFERVLDQVLEQPQQFLAIARDRDRRLRQIDLNFDLAFPGEIAKRIVRC
jgi:hypothetical protein